MGAVVVGREAALSVRLLCHSEFVIMASGLSYMELERGMSSAKVPIEAREDGLIKGSFIRPVHEREPGKHQLISAHWPLRFLGILLEPPPIG